MNVDKSNLWLTGSGLDAYEMAKRPTDTALALSDPNYIADLEKMREQNRYNAEQADIARAFSAEEAQKDRDFQKMMSDTAFQRQRDDLIRAGLNPYLAYSNGGASTPSGSTAQTVSAHSSQGGTSSHRKNSRERLTNFASTAVGTFSNLIGYGFSALSKVMMADALLKSNKR